MKRLKIKPERQVMLHHCNYLVCIQRLAWLLQKDTLVNGAHATNGIWICGQLHCDFFSWDSGGWRKLQRNLIDHTIDIVKIWYGGWVRNNKRWLCSPFIRCEDNSTLSCLSTVMQHRANCSRETRFYFNRFWFNFCLPLRQREVVLDKLLDVQISHF